MILLPRKTKVWHVIESSGQPYFALFGSTMEYKIERQADFSNVSVTVATVNWASDGKRSPLDSRYVLCQRLSGARSPVRIGNVDVHEALPRVGSVGFMPPDCSVSLFPVDKPYRLLACSYEKEYFEATTGITRAQWDTHTGRLVSIRDNRLEILMQATLAELEQPGFGHELLIDSVSALMLIELARYARQLERRGGTDSSAGLALAPWQLDRIQERIDAAPGLGYPNLEELAQLCAVSQSHLMRSFKASTGWQIHKYVAEQRIDAARAMLAQEGHSCREVAEHLGFSSPAYFATAFRRHTGMTPTEYRRRALSAVALGKVSGEVFPADGPHHSGG